VLTTCSRRAFSYTEDSVDRNLRNEKQLLRKQQKLERREARKTAKQAANQGKQ
jgi:hypothetical protein